MKLARLPILSSLGLVAVAQLIVPQQQGLGHTRQQQQPQQPLRNMAPPAIPPDTPGSSGGGPGGTVILTDVLGRDRSINVFAGFTRDFVSVTNRFEDSTQNSTVLAPLNSAIEQLPRKPWEDPADYDRLGADAYDGDGGQERALRNLQRFVEAHIVPLSPWPEKYKAQAMAGGGELWWETNADGKRVIQPGNIEVTSVASTVANGQVWIIKGVRNYSSS